MIDGLTRTLLLKYQPDSPLLIEPAQEASEPPVNIEFNKAVQTMPLETRIALARLQGLPEFVIKALSAQLKVEQND